MAVSEKECGAPAIAGTQTSEAITDPGADSIELSQRSSLVGDLDEVGVSQRSTSRRNQGAHPVSPADGGAGGNVDLHPALTGDPIDAHLVEEEAQPLAVGFSGARIESRAWQGCHPALDDGRLARQGDLLAGTIGGEERSDQQWSDHPQQQRGERADS